MSDLTGTDFTTVGAYWGPRPEPVDRCAQRVATLLAEIAQADPLLATWHASRQPDGAPPLTADTDADTIRSLIEAGRNFNDDGELLTHLGSLLMAHNGQDDGGRYRLQTILGASKSPAGNQMNVAWPPKLNLDDLARVTDPTWLRRLFPPLIRAGDPDSVGILVGRLIAEEAADWPYPTAGWMLWLPTSPARVPYLPEPTTTEPFEGGTLITTLPGPRIPHVTDDSHVEMIRDRNQRLTDAGLLTAPAR